MHPVNSNPPDPTSTLDQLAHNQDGAGLLTACGMTLVAFAALAMALLLGV
jgi:hypothetical protein